MNRKARFACKACRRLKLKCPRELPSCTLCIRLEKKCEYPPRALGSHHHHQRSAPDDPTAIDLDNRRSGSSSSSSSGTLAADPGRSSPAPETQQTQLRACENFPVMYFLDSETCVKPLSPTEALHPTAASAQPTPEAQAVFEAYFSSVHPWLPILSKKRIQRILVDASAAADNSSIHSLLFQCMRLLASPAPASGAGTATLYQAARESLMRAEAAHLPSLALLQSVILLAVYEIAHGVYTAAYLRVGHAARLAVMMGLHDRRHAAQLFRETRTWTGREDQGAEGLPPCTPEPSPGELLPAHETAWDAGAVGFNEPLFASSFSASTSLGAFANTCQAALILGRVLSHRNKALAGGGLAPRFRMSEARQLHAILVSLSTHLNCGGEVLGAEGTWVSFAMCSSARLILYNMYACNERYSAEHERSTEEAEMQKLALGGIIEVARATGQFARQILDLTRAAVVGGGYGEDSSHRSGVIPSPFVAHLLYSAATECEWFILEQQDSDAAVSLREIVELLRVMAGRWQVAGIYLLQIYKWPGYNSKLS
ncbi:hypothetical protein F5X96DRAFT_690015 [Biscogniauxia mediterranea]|nr:hypothetical protein F5X96DRAFT_690015 [Biscogniauxia mediterranea]